MHKVCIKSEIKSYLRIQKLFIYFFIEFFTF